MVIDYHICPVLQVRKSRKTFETLALGHSTRILLAMNLCAFGLLAQLSMPTRQSPPVLAFPEPGLDDTASYQGYQTRFYRDATRNTVQIYVEGRSGRVVHLWADSENASAGFTARDASGGPAPLRWASANADVSRAGRTRTLSYALEAETRHIHLGWFLLGSMRVERDFQYWGRHREPFAGPPFVLQEMQALLTALGKLDPVERRRHLTLVRAPDMTALRARLQPTISTRESGSEWVARVVQPSLDARDTMTIVLRVDRRRVTASRSGDSLSLEARAGNGGRAERVPFTISISTTGRALAPLAREEIFNREFLDFLASARRAGMNAAVGDSASNRARWLERQVRGVELLSSREKLMAGLPAYATYFGRDMLVSALMMRPVWRHEMSAFVVASVLRKLGPAGQVSHEEALGGQAVREAASEYAALIEQYAKAAEGREPRAESLLVRARAVLRDHRRVRENYHMMDDEFQLPILAARWLGDPRVPAAQKRAFLLDSSDGGGPRLNRLLRELALVARMTAAYAANPVAANLVSFEPRDSIWASASWRDSGAGYAGGRFAMDINAIWSPHALEAIATILHTVRAIGIPADVATLAWRAVGPDTPLGRYARDSASLRRATDTWWGASRHFLVRLGPPEVRSRVAARLDALPEPERRYWTDVLARTGADRDSLTFLALALDAQGRPLGVVNSDPATGLFLRGQATQDEVLRDVRLFVRNYPVGLFIDRVGPVVANDAYTTPSVWAAFERDRYHGPRVVWGREVNLFLSAVAVWIATSNDAAFVDELRASLDKMVAAAEASGFQSELWSYELRDGRVVPVRYGTGSDVQLWSTTDLAVQFLLARLKR